MRNTMSFQYLQCMLAYYMFQETCSEDFWLSCTSHIMWQWDRCVQITSLHLVLCRVWFGQCVISHALIIWHHPHSPWAPSTVLSIYWVLIIYLEIPFQGPLTLMTLSDPWNKNSSSYRQRKWKAEKSSDLPNESVRIFTDVWSLQSMCVFYPTTPENSWVRNAVIPKPGECDASPPWPRTHEESGLVSTSPLALNAQHECLCTRLSSLIFPPSNL